jgi:tagaturonate epimerase
MIKIGKYSLGTGDRFSHQGEAQLAAVIKAKETLGIDITLVWNKSNREHNIVHSEPSDTRKEADAAVSALNYKAPYFVDADHINMSNVDRFIDYSDFFTLDVADFIGKKTTETEITNFIKKHKSYCGFFNIPGIPHQFNITEEYLRTFAEKFLFAINEASNIYRHIESKKGEGNFVTEVSMDEVDEPQKPLDMLFILKVLADLKVPVQTIAPKFTGRFNKGVDYEGDPIRFGKEFEEDILVIDYAVKNFGLPDNLKLSVHSGSDKFSIYPAMGKIIKKHDKGIHVKTAGTTWLEEITGLALSGGKGLEIAKTIYRRAYERKEELCAPYATVIDIKSDLLPSPDQVDVYSGNEFAAALQHERTNPAYNPSLRQLLHVGYKVASELGKEYTNALVSNRETISKCVTGNLYDRHILRLFR